jgi:hypothetical protein
MKIEVTDDAVLIVDISPEERVGIEHGLRVSGGKSLILPKKPERSHGMSPDQELEAMIQCIRSSAQDTLAALRHRGIRLARE